MEASNMGKKLWEASKITGEALRRSGDRNQEHQKKAKSLTFLLFYFIIRLCKLMKGQMEYEKGRLPLTMNRDIAWSRFFP